MTTTWDTTAPAALPVPRVQQRLWLADQVTGAGAVYLGSVFLRLHGRLDVEALRRALTEVVRRHEVLRTSLRVDDGEIVGVLHPAERLRLDVTEVDPTGLDEAVRTEAGTPLDVSTSLPIRARLLRVAPDDHVLSMVVHHAAVDRGSLPVLYTELADFYNAFTAGRAPRVPPPVTQFRDLALAEDAREDAGQWASTLAERCAALADVSPFELAPDLPRPPVRTGEGALCHAFDLPAGTVRKLTDLGRSRAATLFMVLLAACQTLLYRYTGRTDVTTGTSSSTRRGRESVIGPFLNMLVVPGDVTGNPAFTELVGRVRNQALDAYEARHVALDTLVTELGVERDAARTPLFQILVDFMTKVDPPGLSGLRVAEIRTPGAGAKYDLSIEFHERGDTIGFFVEWDTALYEKPTVLRLMAHLRAVLVAVAEDPGLRVDDVPVLSSAEVLELRTLAAARQVDLPGPTLHSLFTEQAGKTPDAIAVREGSQVMTYAELDVYSTAIAHGLAARGVVPDVPVGLLMDRSIELVAALLGILKAGGAYVPIDPEAPSARVGKLLATAGAPICVVSGAAEPDLPTAAVDAGCAVVDIDTLTEAGIAELGTVHPDHLCAVYFTSGSTGEPKGVACTHRGWVSQMVNMHDRYQLTPEDAVVLKTPLSFDDVAREVFWPLMVGARIAILPPGLHHDPQALLAAAIEHQVPWLQFVPGTLAMFLEQVGPRHLEGLSRLRHVVSDGDRLRPEIVRAFHERLGPLGCRLNNHWGTTEVSIDSAHHACVPSDGDGEDAVVLGRPMENNSIYVLDQAFQPVPYGAVGELCIGGAGLGRGYVGEPGRTARVFVPHPWRPGERIYRTGDTGRLRTDGSLQYRGRSDHQVKVRGVRIELGEVEAAARACPDVVDAVAATWEPVPGDRRLVVYATITRGTKESNTDESDRTRLRDFLTNRLAPAAVPSAIVVLPCLPRNPSGKVDRRSLPEPDPGELSDEPFVVPETDAEQAVADIWAAVLGTARLGANDDFFAVGGHSLLVTRAVNRMRDAFTVDVPVRLVFEYPTVRTAAARVEQLIIAEIEAMSDAEVERLASAEPDEFPVAQEVPDARIQ
ncbi:amino acid adenylation domain-containing protein [Actinocrispum sp. NPDC049592]|uniref:non-ribosomal peptide synthetase n=1 Tax=Actinocrispum sp. NPDC049592 TaxID=3154835 RepID=UPI00341AD78A